ncbi:hypothetical protein J6590_025584 [Homalodisca vitripennis]|nr:hypothetical protein J6590_025584 [Homalodisca vitripennis]
MKHPTVREILKQPALVVTGSHGIDSVAFCIITEVTCLGPNLSNPATAKGGQRGIRNTLHLDEREHSRDFQRKRKTSVHFGSMHRRRNADQVIT